MTEDISSYLSRIGKRGGKRKSAAKSKAIKANLAMAHEARRKQRRYPPCPRYKNHAHRFSPTGRCPCGYTRKK